MRAFLLAVTMNVAPIAPVDILRFLRVPAIVWVMKKARGRMCSDPTHRRHHASERRRPAG